MILAQVQMTPGNWITLGLAGLGVLVSFGTFLFQLGRLRQAVDDRFATQGARIGEVEQGCAGTATTLDEIRRVAQKFEFQILSLNKDDGEFRARLDRLIETLEKHLDKTAATERDISDRLARIEERLAVRRDV